MKLMSGISGERLIPSRPLVQRRWVTRWRVSRCDVRVGSMRPRLRGDFRPDL